MAERDNPEASGHLPDHFVEAAEAGGLTSSLPASDGDRVAASRYAISAVRGGQYCLDAHWLRRADQVAMRAEVDRICMLCL
jgi:hypothetical protein